MGTTNKLLQMQYKLLKFYVQYEFEHNQRNLSQMSDTSNSQAQFSLNKKEKMFYSKQNTITYKNTKILSKFNISNLRKFKNQNS